MRQPLSSAGLSFSDTLMRAYASLERRKHELLYIFFEITRACNLRCLHCGSDCGRTGRTKRLDTDSWVRIVRYVQSRYPKAAIVLTGGEPLLYPELSSITSALSAAKLRWGLVTNGTLLSGERLRGLINDGLYSITLSLDGPRDIHDWIRNKTGTFDTVTDALRAVSTYQIPHADVVTCVTPKVLERLEETAEIIMQSGIREWRLFRIFPAGRARHSRDLLLDKEQTRQLLYWIRGNRERYQKLGLLISYACEGWIPQRWNRRIRDPLSMCRAGINIASILSDGTVTGCPNNDTRFHVGNIADQNFDTIWEENFTAIRNRAWLKDTACSSCKYLRDCRGSSLHLWREDEKEIAFCYMEDWTKSKKNLSS